MTVLNLGCGYQTSARCVNIDWSLPVRLKGSALGRAVAPLLVTGNRRVAYDAIGRDPVLRHDLRKGIPYPDGSVDAVYHSHLLEHLDRDAVPGFLAEVRRVLKRGGVHRIVVPDLEVDARRYLASLEDAVSGLVAPKDHEWTILLMLHQMVRKESVGTSQRKAFRRWAENRILGDARKRGETHQWMWDRVSLPAVLLEAGFVNPQVATFDTSAIDRDWPSFLLDQDESGQEYRPGSLYVEAFA